MIKQYIINILRGPRTGQSLSADMSQEKEDGILLFPTEGDIDAWFSRKEKAGHFGKPERDYVYKIEYYKLTPSGNRVFHMEKEFPLDPEYDEDIINMGEVEEERPGMIHKKFIYRLKPEYTYETNDLEAEITAKEQAMADEKSAKEACCERLENVDWSSVTTIAATKAVLKDLFFHLGLSDEDPSA